MQETEFRESTGKAPDVPGLGVTRQVPASQALDQGGLRSAVAFVADGHAGTGRRA